MTRRELLERIGVLGAVVALAPIVAACATAGASASPSAASPSAAPATAAPATSGPTAAAGPTATPEPTPVPSPGGRAHRLQLARLHRRGRHPVVRGEVPGQGQVRALRRHRGRLRQARPGRQRLRHLVPDLGRHPALPWRPERSASSTVADPEPRQPRCGVAEPGLRPGQRLLRPVHVVDDRDRLRHDEDQGRRRRARRPSGTNAGRATSR